MTPKPRKAKVKNKRGGRWCSTRRRGQSYDRFDRMQSDFRSLQMGHWLKNSDALASHHQLGGYALFQQQFPEELLGRGLAMFLQIGTDGKTGMGWGDGGELTFYADAKGLAKGRFECNRGTCQGG